LDDLLTTGNIDAVFSVSTLDELEDLVKKYLFNLLLLTQELRKSGNNMVVEKTKEYINTHYNQNITLEMIAKEVFVSPVYLSFLFKQVESINLTNYLTNARIEQAKRLLQTTIYKTYEVAYNVGYQDEKYFSRIFKKKMGMTPTEYRNQF
jgi:two-component system response regulator YesN